MKLTRPFSLGITTIFVLSALFVVLPTNIPYAKADFLNHTIGNLDIKGLTDWGSIDYSIYYKGEAQTASLPPFGIAGLIFDQSAYDHLSPFGIADFWDSGAALQRYPNPDFNLTPVDTSIHFWINDGTVQKSFASFTQVDETGLIGVANDVRIYQTAWTVLDGDWAIIEWQIENIWSADLTNVNVGFGTEISTMFTEGSPGGDYGDDIDYWNPISSTYYVQDDFGTGVSLGFSSAEPSNPFNHYYANPFLDWQMDNDVYNYMTGPNNLIGMPGAMRMPALLSWNGYTIPLGETRTFALVIACGADEMSMDQAIIEAQNFYRTATVGVQITEFQDSSSTTQRLEVYNDRKAIPDLSLWEVQNSGGALLSGDWLPDTNLPTDEYRYFDITDGTLNPEGDIINLYNESGALVDRVAYGQYGKAPDPIAGESTSRIWASNGQYYDDEWTRDPTPTFGDGSVPWSDEQNDVLSVDQDPQLVLNEIFFNPTVLDDAFVELYYLGSGILDITNYKIVCDSEYSIGPVVLDANNKHFILNYTMAQGFFTDMTTSGDNVYLYNSTSRQLDMAGWSSAHTQDMSMTRLPEGNGTYDGYDDDSSVAAGWKFDQSPTIPLIDIIPDQTKFGDLGQDVFYNLTVTNNQSIVDYVEIKASPGWQVTLFDSSGITLLSDTNANGNPDTGLLNSGAGVDIKVRVTVPSTPPVGDFKITVVHGGSYFDPSVGDRAILTTKAYPHLNPGKDADPIVIFEESAGAYGLNNVTTVTLEVAGEGSVIPGEIAPSVDVMFLIDDTGSMGNEILFVKIHVTYITDRLIENVSDIRFGLVSYKDKKDTHMDLDLTYDVDAFKAAINALEAIGGDDYPEDVEGAIALGRTASWRMDPNTTKIMILIGDAPPHNINLACQEAADAYNDDGIHTNTIATANGDQMPDAFEYIAENGSGIFRYIPNANPADPDEFPSAIIEGILYFVRPYDIAGYDYDLGDSKPMINEVLPGYIRFVPGTFKDPTTGFPKNPDNINYFPTNTTLQWELAEILVGETWHVSFDVTSSQLGWVPVGVYPDALVAYSKWDGTNTSYPFPDVQILVISADIEPPTLYINTSLNGKDVTLNWEAPSSTYLDHYLIYRSTSQIEFDFNDVWVNTSADVNPATGVIDPLTTIWIDTNVTDVSHPDYQTEYYYTIRAVNIGQVKSTTSNTVGYYRMEFNSGLNTFSLPLQPFWDISLDTLMNDMNATTVSWLEMNDEWATYPPALPPNAQIGTGYVVEFAAPSSFVFTGEPASMIVYKEGFGFDDVTRDDIIANVDALGNVAVSWTPIAGADKYYLYRSNLRDGFFKSNYNVIEVKSPPYLDIGAAASAGELYYLIVPHSPTQGNGSSTYSIGVITMEYNGNEMFGMPLKPIWGAKSADWYTDQFTYCLGIVFLKNGYWTAHFKEFEEGVYDTTIEYGRGYELTVYDTSFYSYIGW